MRKSACSDPSRVLFPHFFFSFFLPSCQPAKGGRATARVREETAYRQKPASRRCRARRSRPTPTSTMASQILPLGPSPLHPIMRCRLLIYLILQPTELIDRCIGSKIWVVMSVSLCRSRLSSCPTNAEPSFPIRLSPPGRATGSLLGPSRASMTTLVSKRPSHGCVPDDARLPVCRR